MSAVKVVHLNVYFYIKLNLSKIEDLCVKKPYGKLSIVMKCPYKFDESENVHRVKCP